MKTFELMDGTILDIQKIVSVSPIKITASIAASIPAWNIAHYTIVLQHGITRSSQKSWTVTFWGNKPKDPQKKEDSIKKLTEERDGILSLWKSESDNANKRRI